MRARRGADRTGEVIELERDDEVFVLRMRAGENRINRRFIAELHRALDEVEASEGPAALVTTGEGKFFSNGLDLGALAVADAEEARATLDETHGLFARLLTFPMVTVAAINGHAFAAGALLALTHDFRVMRSDRGYLCLPEVDLRTGRPLTAGMYAVLSARLTASTVHEALVTGRRYNAHEAIERGMVHLARPEHDVVARAADLAGGLADKHRPTVGAIKRGLYARELAALEKATEPLL